MEPTRGPGIEREVPMRAATLRRAYDDDTAPLATASRRPRRFSRTPASFETPPAPAPEPSTLTVGTLANDLVTIINRDQPAEDATVYGITPSGARVPLASITVAGE